MPKCGNSNIGYQGHVPMTLCLAPPVTTQAQSRQKQLDKLMAEQAAMVMPSGFGEGPGDTKRKQSLKLPRAPRGAREVRAP